MDYQEADDLFVEIVEEGGALMGEAAKKTAFPEAYRAMFGFCVKLNYLKTALFDMIDSNNPYAFNALFRCYCDHYLKFKYIFVRFLREKSDEVGIEYFSYCGAVEARDYLKAIGSAEKMLGNEVVGDVAGAVAAVYPLAANLTATELERVSGQFKYRAILRFLTGDDGPFKGAPFLPNIIPAFAEFSAFVHGGPWADRDMYSYRHPSALEKCREHAGLAFMMAASAFMFTAMAVSRECPEVGALATRTKAVLDVYRKSDSESAADVSDG